MKIGNSSSKYDFDVHGIELEKDIRDKEKVGLAAMETITAAIECFLRADYRYRDGVPMSPSARWNILIEAMRATKEKYGL